MKDIDQMMSLWAPNATLTVGPGQTAAGSGRDPAVLAREVGAFKPETHWVSDHPAYKIEITVNGDRGTLHFECHYVDYEDRGDGAGHVRRSGRRADRRTAG